MGTKPYLILEIDAHTADAGVQTRLEAFLDIVRSYRAGQAERRAPFGACRLAANGQIIRSNGESVAITDARVKMYFPSFSHFHSQSIAMASRWLGLHTGDLISLDRRQLERGLQYSFGRECLPLPICIGQLLQAHENRQPGEIAGFFMLRGGAPCVVDCYMGYFERFIAEQRMADIFLTDPHPENDYCGFSARELERCLTPAVFVADILVEIEQVLRVVGAGGSVAELRALWESFVAGIPIDRAIPGRVGRVHRPPGRASTHARSDDLSACRRHRRFFHTFQPLLHGRSLRALFRAGHHSQARRPQQPHPLRQLPRRGRSRAGVGNETGRIGGGESVHTRVFSQMESGISGGG